VLAPTDLTDGVGANRLNRSCFLV